MVLEQYFLHLDYRIGIACIRTCTGLLYYTHLSILNIQFFYC